MDKTGKKTLIKSFIIADSCPKKRLDKYLVKGILNTEIDIYFSISNLFFF